MATTGSATLLLDVGALGQAVMFPTGASSRGTLLFTPQSSLDAWGSAQVQFMCSNDDRCLGVGGSAYLVPLEIDITLTSPTGAPRALDLYTKYIGAWVTVAGAADSVFICSFEERA